MPSLAREPDDPGTVGGHPTAGFADLHCGRGDRLEPILLVDARTPAERAAAGLCGAVPIESGPAAVGSPVARTEALSRRQVWVVLSDPPDLPAADRLAAAGAEIVVVVDDIETARELGLVENDADPASRDRQAGVSPARRRSR